MTKRRPRLPKFSTLLSRQFGRFVLVGVWNTFFGYAIFALLNFLLSKRFPEYGYIVANVGSIVINTSVAFLGYKWFVFKTSGHYLREWLRTLSVYSVSIALSLLLMPVFVTAVHWSSGISHQAATYLAGLILTVLSALWNFFGNKNFSFQRYSAAAKK